MGAKNFIKEKDLIKESSECDEDSSDDEDDEWYLSGGGDETPGGISISTAGLVDIGDVETSASSTENEDTCGGVRASVCGGLVMLQGSCTYVQAHSQGTKNKWSRERIEIDPMGRVTSCSSKTKTLHKRTELSGIVFAPRSSLGKEDALMEEMGNGEIPTALCAGRFAEELSRQEWKEALERVTAAYENAIDRRGVRANYPKCDDDRKAFTFDVNQDFMKYSEEHGGEEEDDWRRRLEGSSRKLPRRDFHSGIDPSMMTILADRIANELYKATGLKNRVESLRSVIEKYGSTNGDSQDYGGENARALRDYRRFDDQMQYSNSKLNPRALALPQLRSLKNADRETFEKFMKIQEWWLGFDTNEKVLTHSTLMGNKDAFSCRNVTVEHFEDLTRRDPYFKLMFKRMMRFFDQNIWENVFDQTTASAKNGLRMPFCNKVSWHKDAEGRKQPKVEDRFSLPIGTIEFEYTRKEVDPKELEKIRQMEEDRFEQAEKEFRERLHTAKDYRDLQGDRTSAHTSDKTSMDRSVAFAKALKKIGGGNKVSWHKDAEGRKQPKVEDRFSLPIGTIEFEYTRKEVDPKELEKIRQMEEDRFEQADREFRERLHTAKDYRDLQGDRTSAHTSDKTSMDRSVAFAKALKKIGGGPLTKDDLRDMEVDTIADWIAKGSCRRGQYSKDDVTVPDENFVKAYEEADFELIEEIGLDAIKETDKWKKMTPCAQKGVPAKSGTFD
ncbi:hypothetical protein Pmar_PMAR015183 [Perkinsus marinus ATCC 50983]|uniref:Uncharacterized protein n=2 Tax=Perkinsus marinus (strain ATCC 50983 / TXsc) TaxID=423536 RepID=C5K5N6_PERM5|nr:hypothetical protein Pmar_PMAR015183 [Perkinsus marinus ATCC 50983]EER20193.1 hypothetical protein Pmar_PMAR015183 [Perkinsus marinus ATCC 50983]|eukprot:XP_002788397.1 hypothetical protein Pmar_PMAR015183 [Perkinsus marinus ATCC 50983]